MCSFLICLSLLPKQYDTVIHVVLMLNPNNPEMIYRAQEDVQGSI